MADMNKFVPLWMVDDCELGDDLDETQERDQNPCAVEALTKALGLPPGQEKEEYTRTMTWALRGNVV